MNEATNFYRERSFLWTGESTGWSDAGTQYEILGGYSLIT
jgi:hypothetical protein